MNDDALFLGNRGLHGRSKFRIEITLITVNGNDVDCRTVEMLRQERIIESGPTTGDEENIGRPQVRPQVCSALADPVAVSNRKIVAGLPVPVRLRFVLDVKTKDCLRNRAPRSIIESRVLVVQYVSKTAIHVRSRRGVGVKGSYVVSSGASGGDRYIVFLNVGVGFPAAEAVSPVQGDVQFQTPHV